MNSLLIQGEKSFSLPQRILHYTRCTRWIADLTILHLQLYTLKRCLSSLLRKSLKCLCKQIPKNWQEQRKRWGQVPGWKHLKGGNQLRQPTGGDGGENQSQGWAWILLQGEKSIQTAKTQTGKLSDRNQTCPWQNHQQFSVEHQHQSTIKVVDSAGIKFRKSLQLNSFPKQEQGALQSTLTRLISPPAVILLDSIGTSSTPNFWY